MPVPLLVGAAVGLSAYGAYEQTKAAKQTASAQREIATREAEAEKVRQRAMELDARRRQMEMLRQEQRARAMGLATATAQGASGGSGLQGGYGQIAGQSGVNLLGVRQNLYLGRESFDINQQISQQRINMAGYASNAAFGRGLSSMGSSLLGVAPQFGALMQGFGNSYGNPTGYNQSYGEYIRFLGRGPIY